MTRHDKLAAAVFGDDGKQKIPEWKRLQIEEAARRQALLERQKAARLRRDADQSAEAAGARPPRQRTQG